jgi:hypothetical protein
MIFKFSASIDLKFYQIRKLYVEPIGAASFHGRIDCHLDFEECGELKWKRDQCPGVFSLWD